MSPTRVRPGLAVRTVGLATGGVWLGHMIEHLRAEGPLGLVHELGDSVHLYMVPLGLVLLGFASVVGVGWARLQSKLLQQLFRARSNLRRLLRGHASVGVDDMAVVPHASGWLDLALPLAVAQLVGYGLQVNVEALLEADPVPFFGVFTGAHWGAAFVQAAVAGGLAALVLACRRRTEGLIRRVHAVQQLAHRLWRALAAINPPSAVERSFTPMERFGRHLVQRPPPPNFQST